MSDGERAEELEKNIQGATTLFLKMLLDAMEHRFPILRRSEVTVPGERVLRELREKVSLQEVACVTRLSQIKQHDHGDQMEAIWQAKLTALEWVSAEIDGRLAALAEGGTGSGMDQRKETT